MLYPQSNLFRQSFELSGFWDFRFDPEHAGEAQGWYDGFSQGRPIAVPASWNDSSTMDATISARRGIRRVLICHGVGMPRSSVSACASTRSTI